MKISIIVIALGLTCLEAFAALPKGNAVWVYDVNTPGSPSAMWADWLSFYNSNTLAPHTISTVFTYGGDLEIASGKLMTSFPTANQNAAQIYKNVYGVHSVILTVDGQMNGGQSYSPDLSKLSVQQVKLWADNVASLYCSYSYVDGLQIDLEPASPPYYSNLLVFIQELASDLLKSTNNCLNPSHPSGRSLGVFMGAGNATPAVFQALGTNGYVVMSGYDLSSAPLGTPTNPTQYGLQIQATLQLLASNASAAKGAFIIGIPGAASAHEFTQYVPASGSPVFGYPMYSSTESSYTVEAIEAIANIVKGNPGYLGTALWGFSLQMQNPVGSFNLFFPANPFEQAGQLNYYQGNL